jgi:hypothetical protein
MSKVKIVITVSTLFRKPGKKSIKKSEGGLKLRTF